MTRSSRRVGRDTATDRTGPIREGRPGAPATWLTEDDLARRGWSRAAIGALVPEKLKGTGQGRQPAFHRAQVEAVVESFGLGHVTGRHVTDSFWRDRSTREKVKSLQIRSRPIAEGDAEGTGRLMRSVAYEQQRAKPKAKKKQAVQAQLQQQQAEQTRIKEEARRLGIEKQARTRAERESSSAPVVPALRPASDAFQSVKPVPGPTRAPARQQTASPSGPKWPPLGPGPTPPARRPAAPTLPTQKPQATPARMRLRPQAAAEYRRLVELVDNRLATSSRSRAQVSTSRPLRIQAARDAVMQRCGGRCENPACGGQPDDVTDAGEEILEVDHVADLAGGGVDHPIQMVALCPNCHAMKTRGRKREQLRAVLLDVAREAHARALTGAG